MIETLLEESEMDPCEFAAVAINILDEKDFFFKSDLEKPSFFKPYGAD